MPARALAPRETAAPAAPVQAPAPAPQARTNRYGNSAAQEHLRSQQGGGGGEEHAILVREIEAGGASRATEMLQQAAPANRGQVEAAIREALSEEEAAEVISSVPASGGSTPEVENPEPATEQETEHGGDGGDDGGGGDAGDTGGAGGGGGAGQGLTPTGGPPNPATPQQTDAALAAASTGDLALIHEELIEHQRWAGARTQVGEPGSAERAAFIAERAGEGAVSGGLMGAGMGFAAGAIGKLAARFVPIPGVGAILGGAMSVYGLATRDWSKTADTIASFGEGDSNYEVIANSIASISEVIDLVTNIMNVIAGVIGIISAVMWIISIVTVGVASPLAGTLSAIAMGIGAASGILDLLNNLVLQPCVLLFRALHTFKNEADPREVEAQGAGIADASGRAAGALGGWVGGKAGEAAGSSIGDAGLRRTGALDTDGPSPTSTAAAVDAPTTQPQVDAPTAPAAAVDAPTTPVADVDAPTTPVADVDAPTTPVADVDAPTTQAGDVDAPAPRAPADGPAPAEQRRGMDAIREQFQRRVSAERAALQDRDANIQRAQNDAQQRRLDEIEAERQRRYDEAEAGYRQRNEAEFDPSRHAAELEVKQTAHERYMADMEAAHRARQETGDAAQRTYEDRVAEITSSYEARQQAVDEARLRQHLLEMEVRQGDAARVAEIEDPQFRSEMEAHFQRQRDMERSARDVAHADQSLELARQQRAEVEAAIRQRDAARDGAAETHRSAMQDAERVQRQAIEEGRAQFEEQKHAADPQRLAERADADSHASQRQAGEVPEVRQQAGDAEGARLDAEMAGARDAHRQASREEGGRAVLDGMKAARRGYLVQEDWRPDYMQRAAGEPGTLRHFIVDKMVWPFVEDLTMPFIIGRRMNLNADGSTGQPSDNFDPWAVRGNPEASAPMSRAGNAARGNEKLGGVTVGIGKAAADAARGPAAGAPASPYSLDNQSPAQRSESAPMFTAVNTERVDPQYEEPPGTPEQLDIILGQIDAILEGRAQAEQAEGLMSQQEQQHTASQAPIQECRAETEAAITAQQAHEQAVARRQAANAEQQQRQTEASGLIDGAPERMAGLSVIKAPLAGLRGFSHIASKLPGRAGRAFEQINADANEMNDAFGQMEAAVAEQQTAGPEREAALTGDAGRLDTVQSEAGTSRENLSTARDGAVGLEQANTERATEAAAARDEARVQKEALAAGEERKRSEHASLQAELQAWAVQHRQARLVAIEQQRANASGDQSTS